MHPSITLRRIERAVLADRHVGFCRHCGNEQPNTEPDARGYTCDACHYPQVYGAEELLMEIAL